MELARVRPARSAAVVALLALTVIAMAPAADAGQKLVWEAESCTSIVQPFKVSANKDCSGGKGVFYPDEAPESGTACVNYKLKVPKAGKFTLWARVWWMDGCGDSVFTKVDGGDKFTVTSSTYKKWIWVQLKKQVFELSAGEHVVQFLHRETGIGMDQLLLVEGKYVPVSKLKATPNLVVK